MYRRSVVTGETNLFTFNIDLTTPAVQITGEASYTIGQMVTITCSATDVASGVYGSPFEAPRVMVNAYTFVSDRTRYLSP